MSSYTLPDMFRRSDAISIVHVRSSYEIEHGFLNKILVF